ncbi:hypothetical protein [Fulvimonas yonginensis]|uniref:Lipoprotein n=1 Tax=Fulvimonas yonginensis TaxID=1495200 RepID=A0ABU8JDH7_9GAMM
MFSFLKTAGVGCLVAGLAACSTMTHISSTAPGAHLVVKHEVPVVPSTIRMKDTSFGNYEFKAESPGHDAFYGILPLRFHGGRLAADILFFAPAAFFNLRGAFPYYEIDTDNGVIRYKVHANDPWQEYRPTTAERERAKQFFGVSS